MDQKDDPSISDTAALWRRVHVDQMIFDDELGGIRPTSNIFKDPEMSVTLGDEAFAAGRTGAKIVEQNPGLYPYSFTAGLARQHGQIVFREPEPEDPYHAIVFGKKGKPCRKAFCATAVPVVPIPNEVAEQIRARTTP
jgi:hypothetical protein